MIHFQPLPPLILVNFAIITMNISSIIYLLLILLLISSEFPFDTLEITAKVCVQIQHILEQIGGMTIYINYADVMSEHQHVSGQTCSKYKIYCYHIYLFLFYYYIFILCFVKHICLPHQIVIKYLVRSF